MDYPEVLGLFEVNDAFLRRIDRRRWIARDGTIAPEAFLAREGESSLSFTYQGSGLRDNAALDDYQRVYRLPSGDLPGLCRLTYGNLTRDLETPLPPRHNPDDNDAVYGHLHYVTDCPTRVQMEQMAMLATWNGVVRDLRPKERQR